MNTIKHISQEEYNKQRAEFAQKANLKYTDYKIISLGWDCFSRSLPTWYGIKPTKEQGELSYPFDLAMHSLVNIIKVLQNRFADYLEDIEFEEATKLWYNKKYDFKYNHDQTLTTKEEFRERYSKRIENFYNTIRTSQNIFFIYNALASDKVESILLLCSELRKLCENKNFHLIVVSEAKKKIPYSPDISLCHVSRPWKDYSWWQEDHLTLQGVKFEHKIINKIIKIIQENMQSWYMSETERRWHRRLVHILSCFIPLQKWRKQFRARYMPKPTTVHQYDMIIPLGENCACATLLKRANLRRYSLPFDWSGLEDSAKDTSGGLFTKCRIVLQNCDNLLNFEDFEERSRKGHDEKHLFIVNKKTGLRYMHDFFTSSAFSDQYPGFLEKYKRRVERLYSGIKKAKKILIVYNKVMTKKYYRAVDNVEPYALCGITAELKKKWPQKEFDFLIILHDEKINKTEYKEVHPYKNVTFMYLHNMWPHEETFATYEWLGNRDVVCQYFKDHITLSDKVLFNDNDVKMDAANETTAGVNTETVEKAVKETTVEVKTETVEKAAKETTAEVKTETVEKAVKETTVEVKTETVAEPAKETANEVDTKIAEDTSPQIIACDGYFYSGSSAVIGLLSEFDGINVIGHEDKIYSKTNAKKGGEITFFWSTVFFKFRDAFYTENILHKDAIIKLFIGQIYKCYDNKGIFSYENSPQIYTDKFLQKSLDLLYSVLDLDDFTVEFMKDKRFPISYDTKEDKFKGCCFMHGTGMRQYVSYRFKNISADEFEKKIGDYLNFFLQQLGNDKFIACDQLLKCKSDDPKDRLDVINSYLTKPIKEICVYRDPRDQFLSAFRSTGTYTPPRNVNGYVRFYKQDGKLETHLQSNNPNRLMIRFEDLVLKYDETTKKIMDFIGIDASHHVAPKSIFDPAISVINIGAYKEFIDQDFMTKLGEELAEYCYNPENENLSEEAWNLLKGTKNG